MFRSTVFAHRVPLGDPAGALRPRREGSAPRPDPRVPATEAPRHATEYPQASQSQVAGPLILRTFAGIRGHLRLRFFSARPSQICVFCVICGCPFRFLAFLPMERSEVGWFLTLSVASVVHIQTMLTETDCVSAPGLWSSPARARYRPSSRPAAKGGAHECWRSACHDRYAENPSARSSCERGRRQR